MKAVLAFLRSLIVPIFTQTLGKIALKFGKKVASDKKPEDKSNKKGSE